MSRSYIPHSLRQSVVERARARCEYCLIHQDDVPESHQIDHLVPVKHGGLTVDDNLACACADCNRRKGTDFAAIDPSTFEITPLFNPRRQIWEDHFRMEGVKIQGISREGRATVKLLRLNSDERLLEREILIAAGRHPPK